MKITCIDDSLLNEAAFPPLFLVDFPKTIFKEIKNIYIIEKVRV